jgi:hypothetical protein
VTVATSAVGGAKVAVGGIGVCVGGMAVAVAGSVVGVGGSVVGDGAAAGGVGVSTGDWNTLAARAIGAEEGKVATTMVLKKNKTTRDRPTRSEWRADERVLEVVTLAVPSLHELDEDDAFDRTT